MVIEKFKNMSTGQKVATVVGATAVAGAAVTTGVAMHKGKVSITKQYEDFQKIIAKNEEGTDEFVKASEFVKNHTKENGKIKIGISEKLKEGFSQIGSGIKKLFAKKDKAEPQAPANSTPAAAGTVENAGAQATAEATAETTQAAAEAAANA